MRKEYKQLAEAYQKVYLKVDEDFNNQINPSALERAESVYGEPKEELGPDPKEVKELEDTMKPYEEDVDYLYTMVEGAIGRDSNIEDFSRQDDGSIFVAFSGKGYKINIKPA
jgi:hypothetical protein